MTWARSASASRAGATKDDDATPPDFIFAVKGSRFISHMKRLKDVDNDAKVKAPFDAARLIAKLGLAKTPRDRDPRRGDMIPHRASMGPRA